MNLCIHISELKLVWNRSEVLIHELTNTQVEVFCALLSCNIMIRYQRFGRSCSLSRQGQVMGLG
jgi:hypothetical protein